MPHDLLLDKDDDDDDDDISEVYERIDFDTTHNLLTANNLR